MNRTIAFPAIAFSISMMASAAISQPVSIDEALADAAESLDLYNASDGDTLILQSDTSAGTQQHMMIFDTSKGWTSATIDLPASPSWKFQSNILNTCHRKSKWPRPIGNPPLFNPASYYGVFCALSKSTSGKPTNIQVDVVLKGRTEDSPSFILTNGTCEMVDDAEVKSILGC